MPKFTHKILNLRTPDWSGHVDTYELRQRMRQDAAAGEPWRVVPWMVHRAGTAFRNYLLLGPDGGIYSIIFKKQAAEQHEPVPA